MGRCQEEGGGQQSVSNLCNLNSTCRKDFYSDSTCRKNLKKNKWKGKITFIWTSSKGQQTKAKAGKMDPIIPTLGITIPWKTALGQSRITKLLKGRNWPKLSADLLLFNGRIGAFCLARNGFVWHEKAWKGLKSLLCEARRGPSPWGGARVSTVIVASCCLGVGEIVKWNWLLQPPFV